MAPGMAPGEAEGKAAEGKAAEVVAVGLAVGLAVGVADWVAGDAEVGGVADGVPASLCKAREVTAVACACIDHTGDGRLRAR